MCARRNSAPVRSVHPSMTPPLRFLPVLALIAGPLAAQDPPPNPSRGHLARGTWAIVGANVIPMTSDTVLRDATVVVRDGRVVAVQNGEILNHAALRRDLFYPLAPATLPP